MMTTAYVCRSCGQEGKKFFYKTAKYQCKPCWNKRTALSQQEKIRQIKLEYGGKCISCGYDTCLDALDFHHTDPTKKEFHLGDKRGYNLEKLRLELNKCMLVCKNCHAEIHYKMRNEI